MPPACRRLGIATAFGPPRAPSRARAGVQRALGQGWALRPALPLAIDLLQRCALAVLGHRDEAAAAQLLGLWLSSPAGSCFGTSLRQRVAQLVASPAVSTGVWNCSPTTVRGWRVRPCRLGWGRKAHGELSASVGTSRELGWRWFKAEPWVVCPASRRAARGTARSRPGGSGPPAAVAAVVGDVVADGLVRGADARRVHARSHQVVAHGGRTLSGDAALDRCVAAAVGAPAQQHQRRRLRIRDSGAAMSAGIATRVLPKSKRTVKTLFACNGRRPQAPASPR